MCERSALIWGARERIPRVLCSRGVLLPEPGQRRIRRLGPRWHGSGNRAVVGGEVIGIDAEMCSRGGVGEVEDVQADRYPAHTAAHFERVDTVVEEVAKKLCPGALLAVGGVPDARFASSVIATGAASGICARRQWVAGRALVPVAAGQLASRCGGDRVSGAQT